MRDPLAGRGYAARPAPALTAEQEEAYRRIAEALEAGGHGADVPPPRRHRQRQDGGLPAGAGAGRSPWAGGRSCWCRRYRSPRRPCAASPSASPARWRCCTAASPWASTSTSGAASATAATPWSSGARGALFAPQPDLGLIVIDEEHEWTYKQQEPAPRATTPALAAEKLAGSPAPSSSWAPPPRTWRATSAPREGSLPAAGAARQRLQRDRRRRGRAPPGPLPEVEVVDLREELKAGNRSIFSRSLAAGSGRGPGAGEQVILFLNRRGTAPPSCSAATAATCPPAPPAPSPSPITRLGGRSA